MNTNLYKKMLAVMNESEALDKNMQVGSGSYAYKAISEASVLNVIKPLLKKHGLLIFPIDAEIKEHVDTFLGNKGETSRVMTQIRAYYKIVDVESGESETLATVGNGADTQDKGSGKAWTYAYKALLQKTFCLFSGEDTDNSHSQDMTAANTVGKPKQKELDDLVKLVEEKGGSYDSLHEFLMKHYKKPINMIDNREYKSCWTAFNK